MDQSGFTDLTYYSTTMIQTQKRGFSHVLKVHYDCTKCDELDGQKSYELYSQKKTNWDRLKQNGKNNKNGNGDDSQAAY